MMNFLTALSGGHFGYIQYDTYGTDQIQPLWQLYTEPKFRSFTQGLIKLLKDCIKFFNTDLRNMFFDGKIFGINDISPWTDFIISTATLVATVILATKILKLVRDFI